VSSAAAKTSAEGASGAVLSTVRIVVELAIPGLPARSRPVKVTVAAPSGSAVLTVYWAV
jgi:hypothetical protein